MRIPRLFTFLLLINISTSAALAADHIIFRNGQEGDVKLYQITDDKVIFGYIGDKTGTRKEAPTKDVYMVYIDKQGNVYLTPDGKRITGEAKRVDPKKSDAIYLIKGAEIAADDIRVTDNSVQYTAKSKSSGFLGMVGKTDKGDGVINKSDVFMIRYKSGMVDIINPFDAVEQAPKEAVKEEAPAKEARLRMLIHTVKSGDTIASIAREYEVSEDDLRSWNDISSKTSSSAALKVGRSITVYTRKAK